MTFLDVGVGHINVKRQWPLAVRRMIRMLKQEQKKGARVVTLNEISKEMALAIKALPGWDIHWEINDELPNGNWSGNAIAWRTDHFEAERRWAMPVEIDYRRGKRGNMGPWFKRTIKFACVRLRSIKYKTFKFVVQAFHNPTRFNSNEKSREACVDKSSRFAAGRIKRGVAVILGGDGNNILPATPGLKVAAKEGPDAILTSGVTLWMEVMLFKILRLTDHNGLVAMIRFTV